VKYPYLLAAVAMVAACQKAEEAPPVDNNVVVTDANAATTNAAAPAAGAAMTLLGTSWEWTQDGKPMQQSVDSSGNYVVVSGAEHIDHGTWAQVDGKQCFTSAMTKDGQVCWTPAQGRMEIGESTDATSDKGDKLVVKRVAYVVRKM
jgi:hypothetical protein